MPGIILAVCTSALEGIPKYRQPVATIGEWGFEGDYHNRPERRSYKRRIMVPNTDRHLLLVGQEAKADVVDAAKDISGGVERFLEFGSLSENIVVRGLGDLSQLAGQRLLIDGGKIALRVIEPANPCKHVRAAYGLEIYTLLRNRRGMYCTIEAGLSQHVSPGDTIKVA